MRILGHLLAADVRRFRLLLVVWLLVVAAMAFVDGQRPLLVANPAVRDTIGLLGSLLWLARLLLMIVLVAMTVQAHPLVGTDAFWMTRPIPPRTLLASKAILLGVVMIAAPVFAEAPLMIAYQVPPARIAAVAFTTALFQTFWVTILMIAAAITPSLARFALLCGGALVALAVLVAGMMAFAIARIDRPAMSGGGETEEPMSAIVLTLLTIVAGLALLIVQYQTRSRLRSVPVGAVGLGVAFIAASVWPWPTLAPKDEVPAWAAGEPALRLTASAETVQIDEDLPWFSRRTPWRLARARVSLAGIEPGWSADVGVLEAALELDGQSRLASAARAYPAPAPVEGDEQHPTRGVLRRVLGVQRLIDFVPPRAESAIVFFLREAELRRLAPATGTYRGRFQVRLTRHEIDATLPLQPGAAYLNGDYRFVIDDVERTTDGVSVAARESNVTTIFDRRPRPVIAFYLRNAPAGEAVQGAAHDLGQAFLLSGFLGVSYGAEQVSGFKARGLLIQFPPSHGGQEQFSLDDHWIEGAQLVLVRSTREGSVQRQLEIADFPLRARSRVSSAPPK